MLQFKLRNRGVLCQTKIRDNGKGNKEEYEINIFSGELKTPDGLPCEGEFWIELPQDVAAALGSSLGKEVLVTISFP